MQEYTLHSLREEILNLICGLCIKSVISLGLSFAFSSALVVIYIVRFPNLYENLGLES